MYERPAIKQAAFKAAKSLWRSLPILIGVILLISLANVLIPKSAFAYIFQKNLVLDSFIGSALGSVLAGNPVSSYILGGELLSQGISLTAVTAFLVAWVTVGIVQLPAESVLLGKRFAIIRNITAFLFAVVVALITVFVLGGI
ncbi:permease [Candidatus Woesearchaeota archaeon]|nr:permease [Candidatus Woesearchaeota archaeon]MBW2978949.1 permease [Candidatus Woesearchaeota archaeon]